jgi:hypothetical protein
MTGATNDYDAQALRDMLILKNGDVRAVADDIAADSEDLRMFIMNTPLLRRALDEVIARGVDQSVAVLFAGLNDTEHYGNQLEAAKVFLKSRAAQRRGFHGAGENLELRVPSRPGALTLTWLDPQAGGGGSPPLIEGTATEE